jgi:two-component system chemotaxis response regulator CheB
MDPRHKSMLAGLLGRHCLLDVRQATTGEEIRPATVYIAQPDAHLIRGVIALMSRGEAAGHP